MMLTITDAMKITGLPYSALRRFCIEGKVAFVRSGNKYYINKSSLLAFLGGSSHEHGEETAE